MKTALITGVTGQDGSYLAEFLLDKGYKVIGLIRRTSSKNIQRISHLLKESELNNNFSIIEGELSDHSSILNALKRTNPDEVYNLAAMSDVYSSFCMPEYTYNVDALGAARFLEAIRNFNSNIRFYQASTSELFGKVKEIPQKESTPFYPRSPYGIAKLCAYWSVVNYREAYNIYACNGILFNHESPRRGENFVTRKISTAVANILEGLQDKLILGNLDAERDWGYAKDYVEGMWMMLQQDTPDDYILATGEKHSVRTFVETAFKKIDISIEWHGSGVNEKGIDSITRKTLVEISPELFRPAEVDLLIGDSSKAQIKLNWKAKTTFDELVSMMVSSDIDLARKCKLMQEINV